MALKEVSAQEWEAMGLPSSISIVSTVPQKKQETSPKKEMQPIKNLSTLPTSQNSDK